MTTQPGASGSLPDRIELTCRFGSDSADLEGAAPAWGELAAGLRSASGTRSYRLAIPPDREAAPYDGFLQNLRIIPEDGMLRITRAGEDLLVEGSPQTLGYLAQGVDVLLEEAELPHKPGLHIHEEYFSDHP